MTLTAPLLRQAASARKVWGSRTRAIGVITPSSSRWRTRRSRSFSQIAAETDRRPREPHPASTGRSTSVGVPVSGKSRCGATRTSARPSSWIAGTMRESVSSSATTVVSSPQRLSSRTLRTIWEPQLPQKLEVSSRHSREVQSSVLSLWLGFLTSMDVRWLSLSAPSSPLLVVHCKRVPRIFQ